MIWGCLITGLAIVLLSPANVLLDDYKILAMIGYTLFGVGLAFYATPSTDAALSSLPAAQAGSGAGIYKMLPRSVPPLAWRSRRRSSPRSAPTRRAFPGSPA